MATSAGIIVLLLIAIVAIFGTFFVPLAKNATVVLIQKMPVLLQTLPDYINDVLNNASKMIGLERTFDIGGEFKRYVSEIAMNLPSYVPNFIDTGKTLVYVVIFTLMTPILIFHMLKDWPQIEKTFHTMLTKIAPAAVGDVIEVLNKKLGAYVKGQLLVCCVLSVIYSTSLWIIGADQYMFCGIFSGLISVAPFFGPLLGLFTTLAMSWDEFAFTYQYVATLSAYVVIPLLDSNFLTPRLIGRFTGIKPVWLLFSIGATISILGVAGIFLAVPTAVVMSTVCKEITRKL
jgi:predicted PurR-regulated permease PerM